jgi:RNA polymerase sporulation-specific sigma factor
MSLSGIPGRDSKTKKEEAEICRLVHFVRELDCEDSFAKLRAYLNHSIMHFARKYHIPGCDGDEIEQECLIALRTKAIEDFDPSRGKFKTFAILCLKRHLFSLIKGNNQQKRRVLNSSLSLDEDRSEEGEHLSLASLITEDALSADDEVAKTENHELHRRRLLSKLSRLEQEVFKLYLQQYHYDEIVDALREMFPNRAIRKKTVDNCLQRVRSKAQLMSGNDEIF